jgi:DNA-binding transcriptional MerR regulator
VTSGVNERPYLSIGEVLGLLLEEFPDVTISKIRFLESQGLIEPERTSSGYRKFFDADIERLRVILREQRENFLPLRVIRDRLETGAIDDSGAIAVPSNTSATTSPAAASAAPASPAAASPAPASTAAIGNVSPLHRGIRNVPAARAIGIDDTDGIEIDDPTGTISPHADQVVTTRHPAAQSRPAAPPTLVAAPAPRGLLGAVHSSDRYDRTELCSLAGITRDQLGELESFGIVTGRGSGSSTTYTDGDLAVTRAAAGFLERGIDARHLRSWRQAAEREAGLFEQRVLPLLRQRNPQARAEAVQLLGELADLGAALRDAIVVSTLRHHVEP